MMNNVLKNITLITLAWIFPAFFFGCASNARVNYPAKVIDTVPQNSVYLANHAIYTLEAKGPIDANQLGRLMEWADVVLVGETHDSASDHAFQKALLRFVINRNHDVALSMEHLERDEQELVNQFLQNKIDEETFIEETGSANWAGEGSWEKWYQPMIDLAKENDVPVIAANAPRRYSSMAYKEGMDYLNDLPEEQQAYFSFPLEVDDRAYRRNFDKAVEDHEGMTEEMIVAMYAGQQLWDASMAESILQALEENSSLVIHLAGRFHIENNGGLFLQLKARDSSPNVLTITTQKNFNVNTADLVAVPHPSNAGNEEWSGRRSGGK